MPKQKRESLMLNNLMSTHSLMSLSSAWKLSLLIITLLTSACSVTQEAANTSNSNLTPASNEAYAEAISAMKSGDDKNAQILLQKVIRQQPNFSNAHINLGILFLKKNLLKKAEEHLLQAIKIAPNNIYALNQLGFLYRSKGEFSKAKESYEKAIDINSDYAYAHLNLGILYDLYLYDLENAIEQYKIYLDLSKDDKQVKKWIFELERRQKKPLAQK